MTRSALIVVATACALPLSAAAQDTMTMPRMLKGMEKGQWRMETLEHSAAKPGQKIPAMTICTDNFMKDMREMKEKGAAAKSERQCKQRLVKDGSDEAVMEIACPQRTVTTTIKRESAKSMLMDIKTTGDKPDHIKMRYTNLGPCREGQAGMTYDKNSEQCKKIQASVANMDPVKSCAGAGDQRGQCEKMLRQQIAQAKAMCN